MPWVRIDDQMPQHPKLLRAGPLAIALQVAALCYCNRYLTDGLLPKEASLTLLSFNGFAGEPERSIARLVAVNLWEDAGESYRIHDYLTYQRSRAEIEEERQRNILAGKVSALRRQHPVEHPVDTALKGVSTHPNPNPNPLKSPSPSLSTPPHPTPPPKERGYPPFFSTPSPEERHPTKKKGGAHTHSKITLGQFDNVFLTPEELAKLNERFGEKGTADRIENLSERIASKGYKVKSHYATLLSWERLNEKKAPGSDPAKYTRGRFAHVVQH